MTSKLDDTEGGQRSAVGGVNLFNAETDFFLGGLNSFNSRLSLKRYWQERQREGGGAFWRHCSSSLTIGFRSQGLFSLNGN